LIVKAEIIQKIILTLILFLPTALMYRLAARYMAMQWAVFAGVLYLLNPWVYERFLSGQWLVLLGYALLPLCVLLYSKALERGWTRDWLLFIAFFAVYPIVSIHFAYMAAFVLFAFTVTYFCLKPHEFAHSYKKLLLWGAAALLLLAAVNSYWLVAFFHPATTFEAISQADFAAYQTRTDPTVGVWGNVLSLYGFWNTDFALPKDSLPFWWALSAVIVVAAAASAHTSRFSQAQHTWHYPRMELYPLSMF
jgi:hypothetical protein